MRLAGILEAYFSAIFSFLSRTGKQCYSTLREALSPLFVSREAIGALSGDGRSFMHVCMRSCTQQPAPRNDPRDMQRTSNKTSSLRMLQFHVGNSRHS